MIVALGPAFASVMNQTLADLSHADVLRAILDGIESEGVAWRVVKVWQGADVANIGHLGARLSGSGIGIGLQSKGTALIHKKELAPLNNLELLSMAPNLTLDSYRALGRNAACYATGRAPSPVPMKIDNMARLKLIVHTTLLHHREVNQIDEARGIEEMKVTFR
ncbi:MAG: propanediol dehydratase [Alphaproteobacteria bacterium]|nr:propanediol dehydratase [Alphaproteobacteria bacterium]